VPRVAYLEPLELNSASATKPLVDGVSMPMRSMRTQWRSEDHAGLELH
jgi:hypothetical protein